MGPVSDHHAIGGAIVLELGHDSLSRLIGAVGVLGDDAVEPGPLERGEPVLGFVDVDGEGGENDRSSTVQEE